MKRSTVSGRLGQDVELKYVGEKSTPLAEFDLAVRDWDHRNREETVVWLPCQAWGQQAEFLGQYANKGDTVVVAGELIVDTWESSRYFDEDGNPATFKKTLIKADLGGIELCKKAERTDSGAKSKARKTEAMAFDDDEDDIPF